MSNEINNGAQRILDLAAANPNASCGDLFQMAVAQDIDHAEHAEQDRQMYGEQAAEWQAFLEETGLTQDEVDAIPVDDSYEDEEFRNDWYDDPIDYGE